MSENNLPEALVPDECDLRDFQFMPVDIVRLFNSEFHARSSDSEWRAGVTLWLKSYHQIPAASIPDDDTALARLAEFGRDVKAWKKVREMALYGWIKCSNGRLYHPVVAEKVLEAWIEKLANSLSGAAGNAKRWSVEIETDGVKSKLIEAILLLQSIAPQSRTLKKKLVVTIMAGSSKDRPPIKNVSPPDPVAIAKGSQGTGTGTGIIDNVSNDTSSINSFTGVVGKTDITPVKKNIKPEKPEEQITSETWAAYSEAYLIRYGTEPVRNATVNGRIAQFVKRIGRDEAPHVARFYVNHNNQYYVQKMHDVGYRKNKPPFP